MGQNPLKLIIPKIQSKFNTIQVLKAVFSRQKIPDFESFFSKKAGLKYCSAAFSGRAAFIATLKAMKLKKGDEIIMPGFTFFGIAYIIKELGLTPVFADVDNKNLNINPDKIEELVSKKTKVLLIVHNLGNPNDMDKIMHICRKHKLKLVEDCAHTLGSEFKGRRLGTFGDAAIFSFHYSKIINTFWGGIAATNDAALSKEIKKEIDKFQEQKSSQVFSRVITGLVQSFITCPFVYTYFFSPFNVMYKKIRREDVVETLFKLKPMAISTHMFKFTDFQARIGIYELKKADEYNLKREKYHEIFRKDLDKKIQSQEDIADSKFIPLQLVILSKNKENVIDLLKKDRIEAKEFYITNIPKMHGFTAYRNNCHSIDKIESEIIFFPTFHYLKEKDIKYIADRINHACSIPE